MQTKFHSEESYNELKSGIKKNSFSDNKEFKKISNFDDQFYDDMLIKYLKSNDRHSSKEFISGSPAKLKHKNKIVMKDLPNSNSDSDLRNIVSVERLSEVNEDKNVPRSSLAIYNRSKFKKVSKSLNSKDQNNYKQILIENTQNHEYQNNKKLHEKMVDEIFKKHSDNKNINACIEIKSKTNSSKLPLTNDQFPMKKQETIKRQTTKKKERGESPLLMKKSQTKTKNSKIQAVEIQKKKKNCLSVLFKCFQM